MGVERDYERRRAKLAARAEKADARALLPVRGTDGAWKQRRKPRAGKKAPDAADAPAPAEAPAVEASPAQKKAAIAKLASMLLEAPHRHIKLLRDLHEYACNDASPTIRRLGLLSEVAVLRDLVPAYRIRLPTEKEMAMQVSSDVAALRDYERTLLQAYETCVATLRRWARSASPAEVGAAVRGLAALLEKGRDFNCREQILDALVPLCNGSNDDARDGACAALVALFDADTTGDATLLAVQRMASLLRTAGFNAHPQLLETWLHLRLDGGTAGPADSSKRSKKRRRDIDPLAKEMALAAGERADPAARHGQVLELLFVSYARVIKKSPRGPLLDHVLRGVAQFAHQVNIELLLDLCASIRALLRDEVDLPPRSILHCVHALLQLLSGHGQALAVDTKDVHAKLFSLLADQSILGEPELLAIALDCLDHLCKQRHTLPPPRAASFAHALLDACTLAPHAAAAAALCAASRILIAFPRVGAILDGDDGEIPVARGPGAHLGTTADPDAPAALRTTAWRLALLRSHHHPTVCALASKLARAEPLPPKLLHAAPRAVLEGYSDARGQFCPPPTPPPSGPSKPRARGKGRASAALPANGPGGSSSLLLMPGSSRLLDDVEELAEGMQRAVDARPGNGGDFARALRVRL